MNNPGDSLQLDENLARMLAACDQAMEGADPKAPTIGIPNASHPPLPGERPAGPLSGEEPNEGSYGEVLPDTSRSGLERAELAAVNTPSPGTPAPRVGRFELRRQLGKGGCGIVFLAFDPKLEREVALKIPRPEMLLSQDARRRLIREALAAAEFDHPNLVPVYETGEIGPVCYIATAFCPGQTLGEWLDKQAFPVPVRQTARLVATVAEAVQHAHDRGVLHRDLKPNNVILQATKEDPEQTEPPPGSCQLRGDTFIPRVVDFGLAKLLERGGPSETTTRQILGTPKYMAPEQAQARHEDIGPAADVYALGVILYEMLAGRAPYEGATDVEVLRQAIDGNLVLPRHIRPDVPRDLEAICLKAMDRAPGRRYRTAIDLADDLRRFLDGKPTIARPLKWPARAGRWLRRNDQAVAVVVLAVVATVLLVIGSWSVYQSRQYKSDRDNFQRIQADRTRTDREREYAQNLRAAFLAWRAGDGKAAADLLELARRLAQTGGEPTDFPHEYLGQILAAEKLTIACPGGEVTALAVSPDGTRLATGHPDGTVAVWDVNGGAAVGSVKGHDALVRYVRFEPSGELVSADVRGRARAWVARGGDLVPTRTPPASPDVAAAPVLTARHRGLLFTAGADGVVRGWDASAESLPTPTPLAHAVTALAVQTEGRSVAVATREPAIVRLQGRAPAAVLPAGARRFEFLRFPEQGPLMGIEVGERAVASIEIGSRGAQPRWSRARGVTAADVSPDHTHAALGDDRGAVTVLSLPDGAVVATLESGSADRVRRVAVADEGRLVAVAGDYGVRVIGVGGTAPGAILATPEPVLMRFLPGGERLATAGNTGIVRVFNVAAGVEEWTLYGHVGRVTAVAGSPDGRTLVTGSVAGEVKCWDLRTGMELMSFTRHAGAVTHIEFAANGKVLVTAAAGADGGGEVAEWRAAPRP